MAQPKIHLAKGYSIPAAEYANRGNAILGIRNSGKTYSGMKIAEQLFEADIPFIAFDPVGIWKNLKIGVNGHKGYPVVVAGGPGSDIILTTANAVNIVLAAMKSNISLVIDLFTPTLINKSTWIKIVRDSLEALMQENKDYPLRHIFIEEGAEFAPQKINPGQQMVYATMERLARMGRNMRLGYTIINQRAEEINKAILELCEFTLLHKQVGKNSLISIDKWLDYRGITNRKTIMESIPLLASGHCWALGDDAKLISVLPRNTYHPSPEKSGTAHMPKKSTVNVSEFVKKMNEILQKPIEDLAKKQDKKIVPAATASEVTAIKLHRDNLAIKYNESLATIKELQKENESLRRRYTDATKAMNDILSIGAKYMGKEVPVEKVAVRPKAISLATSAQPTKQATHRTAPVADGSYKPGKCAAAIGKFLYTFSDRSFTKAQIGVASGYSSSSGGFNNSMAELNSKGFLIKEGDRIKINTDADLSMFEKSDEPYSIETFKSKLGKCEREIYEVLLDHPSDTFSIDEVARKTASGYSPTSGGFNNSLARLNTLELIERQKGTVRLNPELLEI